MKLLVNAVEFPQSIELTIDTYGLFVMAWLPIELVRFVVKMMTVSSGEPLT